MAVRFHNVTSKMIISTSPTLSSHSSRVEVRWEAIEGILKMRPTPVFLSSAGSPSPLLDFCAVQRNSTGILALLRLGRIRNLPSLRCESVASRSHIENIYTSSRFSTSLLPAISSQVKPRSVSHSRLAPSRLLTAAISAPRLRTDEFSTTRCSEAHLA